MRTSGNFSVRGVAAALLSCALVASTHLPAAEAQQAAQQGHEHHTRPPAPARFTRTVASYAPPDVTLLDADGAKVALSSVLAHEGPLLLQFIFTTCPTICPVMSGTFAAAQGKLGEGAGSARLVSVSIDPEHDTPERLREYARKFKAGPRWLFLTGGLEEIVAVQKSFDAYRGSKMRHEPLTFLRAAPSKPWVRLDGLMSAAQLLEEYERAVAQ